MFAVFSLGAQELIILGLVGALLLGGAVAVVVALSSGKKDRED